MAVKFIVEESPNTEFQHLIYREEDCTFDSEPLPAYSYASILVNHLQLEIDFQGRVGYVRGYCPLSRHQETDEFPQSYTSHRLMAILRDIPDAGSSERLNDDQFWLVHVNKEHGWVCIGDPYVDNYRMIEFAPDCIATLVEEELVAVWLHPRVIRHPNGSVLSTG